jgi:hypothetical protein
MQQYEREFAKLTPAEKETTMELMTSWEKTGMERVVLRLLRRQIGEIPMDLEKRLEQLRPDQIDALTDALLDIHSIEQVETWLARHQPQ